MEATLNKETEQDGTYKHWTPEEDAILEEHWEEHGVKWDGWKKLLPDRSPTKIRNRAAALGIRASTRATWSEKDDDLLRKFVPEKGLDPVFWKKKIPNRTFSAITNRVYRLGLSVKSRSAQWDDVERDILAEHTYSAAEETGHSVSECFGELGRMMTSGQISRGYKGEEDA